MIKAYPLILAAGLLLTPSVKALTTTYSTTAPTVSSSGILNLAGSTTDAGNVNAGGDVGTYIAQDQGAQGQTFTTGNSAGGYRLTSITLQNVAYTTDASFYNTTGTTTSFAFRLGTLSGTNFTQLASESGSSSPGFGVDNGSSHGTGTYITLTLATPVLLAANTTYAFDVGVTGGTLYFETNGSNTSTYANGAAYTSGSGGVGAGTITNYAGDRAFAVSLNVVPEPSTYAMLAGAATILTIFRRRRTA